MQANVSGSIYNKAYLEEYEKRAVSPVAGRLYASRWQTVRSFCAGGVLLDYGCATGAFHKSSNGTFETYGYDVNPFSEFNKMPELPKIDVLTMWDVIEHLTSPIDTVAQINAEWVILSTPNIDNAADVFSWKHYKPGEHIHYFSKKSLEAVLGCAGYRVIHTDFSEGFIRDPTNREAIITAVAKRM